MRQTKRVQQNVAFVTLLRGGKALDNGVVQKCSGRREGSQHETNTVHPWRGASRSHRDVCLGGATISYSGAFLDSTAWRETDVAKTSSVDADGDNVIGDDGYVFLSEYSTSATLINAAPAGLTVAHITGNNFPYGGVNSMDSVFETPDDDVTNVSPGQWRTGGSGYPTVFTITFNSAGNYLVTLFGDISTAGANNNPTKWKLVSGATSVEEDLEVYNGSVDCYVFRVDGNVGDVVEVKMYGTSSDDTRFGGIAFEIVPPPRKGTVFLLR
jgi:hypothetical protein